jgi:BolA family transcriptional regulator, general stress-responsive regulator
MQMDLGPIGKIMESKLNAAFSPVFLAVIDESRQHHGHVGAHPSGESHFRVRISAAAFVGKSRIAQHRMINAVLAEELKARVHALAIEVI